LCVHVHVRVCMRMCVCVSMCVYLLTYNYPLIVAIYVLIMELSADAVHLSGGFAQW